MSKSELLRYRRNAQFESFVVIVDCVSLLVHGSGRAVTVTRAEGAEGHCEGMAPIVFLHAAFNWLDSLVS